MGIAMDNLLDVKITRRGFGLSAAAATSVLAGFGSLPVLGQSIETPKRGGKLRVATDSQSTNDTFDSARFRYINDYVRGGSFYNTLTVLNAKGEPVPELAESWEADKDGALWVFKIRKG